MTVAKSILVIVVITMISGCGSTTKKSLRSGQQTTKEPSAKIQQSTTPRPLPRPASISKQPQVTFDTLRTPYKITLDSSSSKVPVEVLMTSDGIQGDSMYSDQYAKTAIVKGGDAVAGEIQAYGTAFHIWIGPRGWTGSSSSGADGNLSVNIFPQGGSDTLGPHINYYEIPGCVGCMLSAAAPYFPTAMQAWDTQFNDDGTNPIDIPPGLRVTLLSPTLVTYTLPDTGGLSVQGVVYYDSEMQSEVPFAQAEFVLPHQDSTMCNFLLQTFIVREGLK